ncbi:MAG: VanZ family protein [Candidatus Omnitrophica bacterium]|nr:VanZ family protein [Candidatus Omnitrophota bacterium]
MAANKANKFSLLFFLIYWLPVALYAIIIFSVSSIPGEAIPYVFSFQDVVFHIIEYAIFAFLLNRAFKAQFPAYGYARRVKWVFLLIALYALTDEFHQSFTPERYSSLTDVAFDMTGVLLTNIFYR